MTASDREVPVPDLRTRLQRAGEILRGRDVGALLVGPSPDLFWLSGYRAPALERLTLLLVPARGHAVLLVPELEAPRAQTSGVGDVAELVVWGESEDPIVRVRALLAARGLQDGRLAVQDRLWAVFLLRMQETLPAARWVSGAPITRALRIRKSTEEIAALAAAAAAIDRVHARVPDLLRPGRTEAAVGRDISDAILAEHDEVNFVIVASGPNGASPHHETGSRTLAAGDAVVVDIGGTRDGYCSDMTRNYVLGAVPDGYQEVHDLVEAAQRAGVQSVRPGVTAEQVDRASRRVIEDAGYGALFTHRTGHGIGVEEHEDPYLVDGNVEPLEPGMAFSVEPGVYLPGRYGARIEDIVVVTGDGARRLNQLDRDLVRVSA
ncbi:MAG TPA: Xaa-Pro peptidase family protein [Nitriliruptorales bacterium]|nr:Xaa-Pro peptidase family protein [Nitriliruptorales bacterium]